MVVITWSEAAKQQMTNIHEHYPFDQEQFRRAVATWIDANYKSWRNGTTHQQEFAVAGPAVSLMARVVTQIRGVTDYFAVITARLPGLAVTH